MFAKYAKVIDIGIQNTFVYRWNFLLRSFFGLIPLGTTVFIWGAVFEQRGANIGSYDFASMIWYFLLVLFVDEIVSATDDEWKIAAEIREGQISSFVTRPLNYLAYRISLSGAYRAVYLVVTLIPLVFIFLWFNRFIALPTNPLTWFIFPVSLIMATAISFFISYTLALAAFWLSEVTTLFFIVFSFEYFLSGKVLPLDIMPAWLQETLKWLPFTYEIFFPVQVFMEKVTGPALWEGLAIQAGWVFLTYLGAALVWRAGIKRYQAAGG